MHNQQQNGIVGYGLHRSGLGGRNRELRTPRGTNGCRRTLSLGLDHLAAVVAWRRKEAVEAVPA